MQYTVSFLEGIITFISPCLLPMLPIYISYFAAGGERGWRASLSGALGFVLMLCDFPVPFAPYFYHSHQMGERSRKNGIMYPEIKADRRK